MFRVSDVARLLNVEDKNQVKYWCYKFSDYLSNFANPEKGQERTFSFDDLRVLSLISFYWEDEPDYEAINARLTSGDHYFEMYTNSIYIQTSLFQEMPDEVGEDYRFCVALNGEFTYDSIEVARSYKAAGEALINQALNDGTPYQLVYPIFFNYRHAIELYLKLLIGDESQKTEIHDIAKLMNFVEKKYNQEIPLWMRQHLEQFYQIDPGSLSFRYAGAMPPGERERLVWIDLYQLRFVMDTICGAIDKAIGFP